MLTWIFNVLIFLVQVASWVLLAYLVLRLILPQNKYTLLAGKYVEPLLEPIRVLIRRFIPKLDTMAIDFSPIGAWLLLQVASWLLSLLKVILL
ncbi:MAG: hypothetical protein GX418_01930 [Clostridiales bacterium]|nr:hypothetical protein [Clostridiales bacterium]